MAYTPTDWECGDTVTAEKLNNIERGVAEMNSEYTPTTWECGDLITAEKMNKIEQGIAQGGGGGSSDFSTAEVTLTIAPNKGSMPLPCVYSEYSALAVEYVEVGSEGISSTFSMPLYKGTLIISANVYGTVATTGAAEYNDGLLTITGDCTITIS